MFVSMKAICFNIGDAGIVADLESRFSFHSVHEFPAPDSFANGTKTYPSIVGEAKKASEFIAITLMFHVVYIIYVVSIVWFCNLQII